MEKRALTPFSLDQTIARRWSPRAFDPDKPVPKEFILSLCESGRWAPSCFGDEPWRFIVFNKFHNQKAFQKAFQCLVEWNRGWVKNCPVLLLALSDKFFRKNKEFNRWAQYDTGAASENICLQATSMGLMAHQTGGFDEEKTLREFNIPENFTPMAFIAVGFPASAEFLDEKYLEAEKKERFRRPLGTTFFDSAWENPVYEE